jgi:hypothetical protein
MRAWSASVVVAASCAAGALAHADGPGSDALSGSSPGSGDSPFRLRLPWLLGNGEAPRSPLGTARSAGGLELQLDHDFTIAGTPMTLSLGSSEGMEHAAGDAITKPLPAWHAQLVVRLHDTNFLGLAADTNTAAPQSPNLSLVFGQKF